MKKTLGTLIFILLIFGVRTYAASIIWPADIGLSGPYTGGDYDYVLGGETTFGAGFGVWLDCTTSTSSYATFQVLSSTVGNAHIWFPAEQNDAVDAELRDSSTPFVNTITMNKNPITLHINQIFLLGFWVEGAPGYDETYGWASLLWDGTTLSLVDSAAETTGVGIYAGTYNPIPEPTTAGLALVGIAALLRRRRRIGGGT